MHDNPDALGVIIRCVFEEMEAVLEEKLSPADAIERICKAWQVRTSLQRYSYQ